MDKNEKEQVKRDARWWRQIEGRLDWKLLGFTYRDSATFITTGGKESLQLSGAQFKELIDHFEWSESNWDGG